MGNFGVGYAVEDDAGFPLDRRADFAQSIGRAHQRVDMLDGGNMRVKLRHRLAGRGEPLFAAVGDEVQVKVALVHPSSMPRSLHLEASPQSLTGRDHKTILSRLLPEITLSDEIGKPMKIRG